VQRVITCNLVLTFDVYRVIIAEKTFELTHLPLLIVTENLLRKIQRIYVT